MKYLPVIVNGRLYIDKSRVTSYGIGEPISEHVERFGPFSVNLYNSAVKFCNAQSRRTTNEQDTTQTQFTLKHANHS